MLRADSIIAVASTSLVTLRPGLVLSNAVRAMLTWCKTLAAEVTARTIAAIPAGRLGRPEEFGDIATFLAAPCAGFITGTAIKVDGGQTAAL